MESLHIVSLLWLMLCGLSAAILLSSGRRVLPRALQMSAVPAVLVELTVALWMIADGQVGTGLGLLGFLALLALPIWEVPFRVEAAIRGGRAPRWHPES